MPLGSHIIFVCTWSYGVEVGIHHSVLQKTKWFREIKGWLNSSEERQQIWSSKTTKPDLGWLLRDAQNEDSESKRQAEWTKEISLEEKQWRIRVYGLQPHS